ncbi:MAG TPA: DNA translocase FtsK [Egibacteraceae bacterium]|nr:DNA translocase FtsK [Egibacteraceae bacterium]
MARQTTKRAPASTTRRSTASRPASRSGRSSAGRSTSSGRSSSSRSTARSTSTNRRQPSRRTPPPPQASHAREVWGIGLLVLAALTALGVWFDSAGTLGVYLMLLFRGLFGVLGLFAPVALVLAGVMLLREKSPDNGRVAVGAGVTIAAVAGLWHLAAGAPAFGARPAALHRAAGWLGAAMSLPLQQVAATAGAVVLLLGLLALGILITTATPPRTVVRWVTERLGSARDRRAEARERRRLEAEEHTEIVLPDDESPDDEAAEDDQDAGDETAAVALTTVLDDDDDPDATGPIFEGVVDDEPADGADEAAEATDTQLMPATVPREQPEDTGALKLAPPAGGEDPWAGYELPPLTLLRGGKAAPGNKRTLDQMTRALEHTLQQFGVDAKVARVSRGPTVTRFELQLGDGVRVGAVTKLGDDISYALATAEIRIVAPIPGKSAIGIEVPNRDRDLITLGDVLRSPEAEAQRHPMAAGIGVDISGNSVMVNLASMPHLLIAGATGSGKSVTMNGIVTSIIARATPAQVRMILVDPKRVELNHYDGAPHLLTPVVTDPKRATEALAWTVKEMEQRYERLALLGYRNIDTYNQAVRDGTVRTVPTLKHSKAADLAGAGGDPGAQAAEGGSAPVWEPLPYILFVIDELADLMMVAPRDVEGHIVRIAQMARAVGIHLIVATQRPSVDVVTGLIKANIPSRIALAMATQADSRTILDQGGAEKLVGLGDMLFMPANASKPHRIQGCYLDEREIEQIVDHCKKQRQADYASGIVRSGDEAAMADMTGDDASDEDLTRAAMELVVRSGLGSTSMLQRKLKVGFARAGRLMDELETMGVVGPSEGPKARQVLMTVEELENRTEQGL